MTSKLKKNFFIYYDIDDIVQFFYAKSYKI